MKSGFKLILFFLPQLIFSQLLLNEASNKNISQLGDSDGDYPDWIELYNQGPLQSYEGYFLSDTKLYLQKWEIPSLNWSSSEKKIVFASGKSTVPVYWSSLVREDMEWLWLPASDTISPKWKDPDYNAENWLLDIGGFGFGDDDDRTVLPTSVSSVYTRINFELYDLASIKEAILHVDFDDGFVAYLNGVEIFRRNVNGDVNWSSLATELHEARLYQNQLPEEFKLKTETIRDLLWEGTNVLAIQGINFSATSGDLSLRSFLSFRRNKNIDPDFPTPSWFPYSSNIINLHSNFKIDPNGETIYLSKNGIILDSLKIPANVPFNGSYGKNKDGKLPLALFETGSPGDPNETNTAYTQGIENTPRILTPGSLFNDSIVVTILPGSASCQIHYTTNGQTPSEEDALYQRPLVLKKTSVVKASCFSTNPGKMKSEAVSSSYIQHEINTEAAIISISTDYSNLYGETGIYDNYSTDWKRPCFMEYFDRSNHSKQFGKRAAIKIEGGAGGSRYQPQRSFRLEPGNGTMGDGAIDYPLFEYRPHRTSFEKIYLRNGSNQYMRYPCKDAIQTRAMARNSNVPYSEFTPVQVYLNGEYWGMYELREKLDADFFDQHYGIDKDSLELLSVSYFYNLILREVEGEQAIEHFNNDQAQLVSLNTDDQNYISKADKIFDMKAYTDYICMHSWSGNKDWPYNNIKIFRGPSHPWKFCLIDLELSLDPHGWENSSFDHIQFMKDYDPANPYLAIWKHSMNNESYRHYFINRFADLMNSDWLVDSIQAVANDRYNKTKPELVHSWEKWEGAHTLSYYRDEFEKNHSAMLFEFSVRSSIVRNHLAHHYELPNQVEITLDVYPEGAGKIKISTLKPSHYPWTGIYFNGVPIQIEAVANPGYEFSYWNDIALITNIQNRIFQGIVSEDTRFEAYFIPTNRETKLCISEINYHSAEALNTGDWLELWNYSDLDDLNISGYYLQNSKGEKLIFPSGTEIPKQQRLLLANDTLAFSSVNAIPYFSAELFKMKNSGDRISLFDYNDNLLGAVPYDDVSPWPFQADGYGKTLELKDPELNWNDPSNWYAGCVGGSPGTKHREPCQLINSSVELVDIKRSIFLYPNPGDGHFTIEGINPGSNLSIYNSIGTLLDEKIKV
ncbi:MAG: CotH kinase family protein, partial [Cytophagaceae bacterium]|nr:CotH kinase family protein [Cytophagaceae bacterium]